LFHDGCVQRCSLQNSWRVSKDRQSCRSVQEEAAARCKRIQH
jgi:hypothetical protein